MDANTNFSDVRQEFRVTFRGNSCLVVNDVQEALDYINKCVSANGYARNDYGIQSRLAMATECK